MKTPHILSILLLFSCLYLNAQDVIKIPYGTTPVIDGVFNSDEWDDCGSILLEIMDGAETIEVRYKHDSINLHLVYMGHLESTAIRFPEVLLDVNNDKSDEWMEDDWWFHVSATDCEYQGEHSNYDSCETVRPNWTAGENMTAGSPLTDTIEIQIPFETIGLDIFTVDTIGISFEVTNTATLWEYWPSEAEIDVPSTWGNAVFLDNTTANISTLDSPSEVTLYPNPAKDIVFISGITNRFSQIIIYDLKGMLMASLPASDKVSLENLSPGTYILQLRGDHDLAIKKLVVE